MDAIGLIGGGAVLVVAAVLVTKYFPKEIAEFVRRAGAPSASSIKKQSDEMLADMDRNVAERKARQGRGSSRKRPSSTGCPARRG